MKIVKTLILFSITGLIAINTFVLTTEKTSSSFELSSLLQLTLANAKGTNTGDGEAIAGDGIKNVVTSECKCTSGKTGYTLKCRDVVSSGETCTSDPLNKCYKVKVSFPFVWNTTTEICD